MRTVTILRLHISALLFLAAVSGVWAQNPPATEKYGLNIYSPGAAANAQPISSTPFVNTDINCNQAPLPATVSTVNPVQVEWDDPANVGRKCLWRPISTSADGVLVSLPIGSYEGAVTFNNDVGVAPESTRVPFSRAQQPVARTGVRIVR